MNDWAANLVDDDAGIRRILDESKRIAVLGIRPEDHGHRPACYVPAYLQSAGYEIVPVPVYHPDRTEMHGERVYRSVAEVPGDVDIVLVFRRSEDVPAHLDDILEKRPDVVWMQSGIRNDEVAETLAREGIRVVQDRCAMIEHRFRRARG